MLFVPPPWSLTTSLAIIGQTIGHHILEFRLGLFTTNVCKDLGVRVERITAEFPSASDGQRLQGSKYADDESADNLSPLQVGTADVEEYEVFIQLPGAAVSLVYVIVVDRIHSSMLGNTTVTSYLYAALMKYRE